MHVAEAGIVLRVCVGAHRRNGLRDISVKHRLAEDSAALRRRPAGEQRQQDAFELLPYQALPVVWKAPPQALLCDMPGAGLLWQRPCGNTAVCCCVRTCGALCRAAMVLTCMALQLLMLGQLPEAANTEGGDD